jgi:hypothetical protein
VGVQWIEMKTSVEISSRRGLRTVGHTGTFAHDASNALLRINLYFGAQKCCLSKLARRLKNPRAFTRGSVKTFPLKACLKSQKNSPKIVMPLINQHWLVLIVLRSISYFRKDLCLIITLLLLIGA